jgi:hypothetical protein
MKYLRAASPVLVSLLVAGLGTLGCSGKAGPSAPGSQPGRQDASPNGPITLVDGAIPTDDPQDAETFEALPDGPPTRAVYDLHPLGDAPPGVIAVNSAACQFLQKGPYAPVAGAGVFSDKAPPIMVGDQAYRISIPAGPRMAHVTFTAPALGDYIFFVNLSLPVTVFDLSGNIIPIKALNTLIQDCTEVKGRHTYTLPMGSYVVRFGMYNAPSVDVVAEAARP